MAVTVAAVRSSIPGDRRQVTADVTLDNYVTGGYLLTPSAFGLTTIENVSAGGSIFGYPCEYVRSTNALKCYSAAGTETANAAATLAAKVVTLTVTGT